MRHGLKRVSHLEWLNLPLKTPRPPTRPARWAPPGVTIANIPTDDHHYAKRLVSSLWLADIGLENRHRGGNGALSYIHVSKLRYVTV